MQSRWYRSIHLENASLAHSSWEDAHSFFLSFTHSFRKDKTQHLIIGSSRSQRLSNTDRLYPVHTLAEKRTSCRKRAWEKTWLRKLLDVFILWKGTKKKTIYKQFRLAYKQVDKVICSVVWLFISLMCLWTSLVDLYLPFFLQFSHHMNHVQYIHSPHTSVVVPETRLLSDHSFSMSSCALVRRKQNSHRVVDLLSVASPAGSVLCFRLKENFGDKADNWRTMPMPLQIHLTSALGIWKTASPLLPPAPHQQDCHAANSPPTTLVNGCWQLQGRGVSDWCIIMVDRKM